ncbi:hypothetical protein FA09DRAFT_314372 [Tilletiopsis washingtonensis]|uniref:Cation efflux protein transmembrane domain-containing protein n=1 Tax=Tilletiopsis washingtonensis TaxID=58919 RepID=A0A316ZG38_9BASI|nr:hypothetical protein FA09DRAFT_314372 [Tilletiopsis washingtonensis]PWO00718.1 hypothetical protein FA09DRAFT_314372 [Tilletiopsis washingtonensis]
MQARRLAALRRSASVLPSTSSRSNTLAHLRLAPRTFSPPPRFTAPFVRAFASQHTPPPRRPTSVRPLPSSPLSSAPPTDAQAQSQTAPAAPPPRQLGPPRLVRHPTDSGSPDAPFLRAPARLPPPPGAPAPRRLFAFRNSAAEAGIERAALQTGALLQRQILQREPEQQSSEMGKKIVDSSTAAEAQLRQRAKPQAAHAHAAGAHAHSHAHGHHGHDHAVTAEEADRIFAALQGKGDRGSNITLIGLGSNLVLCIAKTIAGVLLHSASLLADAAHSLSDMFSDIVTLFCWKMSRRTPSETHPLGYGKYETMGGLGVSVVLVAGALGIGAHSYGLLLHALEPTLLNAPAFLQTLGAWTGAMASGASHLHEHSHDDAAGLLDPNAMWFAAASVAVKEWLYRATLKVAKEENSSVLEANALHHRSDSLSSGVTFLAILGSWLGFPVLDPLGGLLVAGLIGKQGFELLLSALGDLTDRGVEPEVREELARVLQETLDGLEAAAPQGVTFKELTGVKHGVAMIVDVTLCMPAGTTLQQAHEVELKVVRALEESNKGIKEVRVRLDVLQQ